MSSNIAFEMEILVIRELVCLLKYIKNHIKEQLTTHLSLTTTPTQFKIS